jgi:glutamate/tyrosine decarboxylase-like PLP-dependent enzyme
VKEKQSYHMELETFRKNGYAAIDWVVDYLKNVESYPVLSQVKPGDIRKQLPDTAPEKGESFEAMLKDVQDVVIHGIEGLQFHIRQHVALSQQFKQWVIDSDDFKLVVDNPLNLVCFRHKDGDEKTEKIMQSVNETGKAYLTYTKLNDKYTIRMSIGQTQTEIRHVENAWHLLQEASDRP